MARKVTSTMSSICDDIFAIVRYRTRLFKHIHCQGVVFDRFLDKLKQNIENATCYNCVDFFDNPKALVDQIMQNAVQLKCFNEQRVFIILKIELLCSVNKTLLKAFFQLFKENDNVKLITLSEKSWFKIESNYLRSIFSRPIQFSVPNWKPNRFPQVVAQALGTSVAFAKIALYFAEPHYSKQKLLMYICDKIADECKALGFSIDSEAFSMNKRREISEYVAKRMFTLFTTSIIRKPCSDVLTRTNRLDSDLFYFPSITRCAIIAAYCASYNPVISDRIFFFSGKDLLKRSKRRVLPERERLHEIGPKPFDHQRGLFIFTYFWSKLREKLEKELRMVNTDYNRQITIMLQAGALQCVSATLDQQKYKCLYSFSTVEKLAKSLEYDLKIYLYDFINL